MNKKLLNYKLITFESISLIDRTKTAEELLVAFSGQDECYDSLLSRFINKPSESALNELRVYLSSVTKQLDNGCLIDIVQNSVLSNIINSKKGLEILSRMSNCENQRISEIRDNADELLEMLNEGYATQDTIDGFYIKLNR